MVDVSLLETLLAWVTVPLGLHSGSDDNLSMGMLSATKQLTDTHTLFLGGGTLVENFKGDLGVIGVLGKVNAAVT